MADKLSKIRDLIVFEARRRKSTVIGPDGRPNARAVWRAMGETVSPTTIQRILNLERNLGPDGTPEEYDPSPQLKRGLMYWLNLDSEADLVDAWETTPRVKPPTRRK